jgi:3-oxoacyl-[acyl-carrier-protein] synthase II
MNILGTGIIFSRGRGIDCFEDSLKSGWREPSEVSGPSDRKHSVYGVGPETLTDRAILKNMRRSDKLSRMAVLAAADAIESGGIANIKKERIGIIVASAFGAHATTFKFLDDIIDFGEANVSPTVFSNSVHNAACSYISSALDIHGPTLTITQFYFSFQYALQLAQAWIDEERCDYVLAGAVDQCGAVLEYVYNCKLIQAQDGRIKPFHFNPTFQVPGEGAVFFLVSKRDTRNVFCTVESVRFGKDTDAHMPADLNIIDTDGMLADESVYVPSLSPDIPAAAYSPLFGSMMIGSAFNCAAGALTLKNQMRYANPVGENPRGIHLLNDTGHSNVELIRCIRYNCHGEKAVIYLNKYKEPAS